MFTQLKTNLFILASLILMTACSEEASEQAGIAPPASTPQQQEPRNQTQPQPEPEVELEAGQVAADMLVYQVEEQGAGIWFSRILVTEKMIRLDEPEAGDQAISSFTLYDRKSEIIYNIDLGSKTALRIEAPVELTKIGQQVAVTVEATAFAADAQSGLSVQTQTLKANDETCIEITNSDDQMQDARSAMNELYTTLARQHAMTLEKTPPEFVSNCDIALHVKSPAFKYGKGVMLSATQANQKETLVDFSEDFAVPESLFQIPEGVNVILPSNLSDL